jgi:hypothetical protein|uniref:Uncharacterized protein n=1 Tax=Oryza sativa subsp. japonica TaxID=39947 RepID=Q656B8_ORYSJ|nr:hypothetical protein [Oryza sativa Japonica Group]BAD45349.1 hypothetical protein [Oryza sativa Japonica Group]
MAAHFLWVFGSWAGVGWGGTGRIFPPDAGWGDPADSAGCSRPSARASRDERHVGRVTPLTTRRARQPGKATTVEASSAAAARASRRRERRRGRRRLGRAGDERGGELGGKRGGELGGER